MNQLTIEHAIADLKKFGIRYFIFHALSKFRLNDGKAAEIIQYNYYKNLPEEKIKDELCYLFKRCTGKELNLEEPKTYNEKIQWLKLYDKNPLKTKLADKYLVRGWIKEKIGSQYLIPLLGKWNTAEEINFNLLPTQFVLKTNHGCGCNIIVRDKKDINIAKTRKQLNQWLSLNFAYMAKFEMHYAKIAPLIIAEEYIENLDGDIYDYKFWCFDGKVEFIMFLSGRQNGLKMLNLDTGWRPLPFVYNFPKADSVPPKPDNLNQMINIAEKLSQGFKHVRVDLYRLNDGSIKFGEMTFTSATGFQRWEPEETNEYLGSLIHLDI